MAEEDRINLAPMEIHGRSDEIEYFPRILRRKESSGKWLVYSLTVFVIVFAFCLILALVFLKISNPKTEIVTIFTRDLRFSGNSTNPYFNATLEIDITISNSNFGGFEFGNSSLQVRYADHGVVGETTIIGRRIHSHKTVRISGLVVKLGSFRLLNLKDLDSDLRLGFLELRSVAEIRGRIKVLGRRKWKVSVMSCTMILDLTGEIIQKLRCNN